MNTFQKASKAQAKSRIAMIGPSGSGKTFTALTWAEVLAESGKVAVIDTERNSASLYADKFEFDVLSFNPPYHPERLIEVLDVAESEGYAVVVIDSLSHFWAGAGGVLEIVDEARTGFAKGNTYAAWGVGTPLQQKMIDRILSHPAHIIATMRSKTDWQISNDNGRITPTKIGLAPQQRDGVEYEFTLVLDIDIKHRASVSKTRYAAIADRSFDTGETKKAAQQVLSWLKEGAEVVPDFRDNLRQRISAMPEHKKETLRSLWDAKGLPKLDNLTQTDLTQVEELFSLAE